MIKISVFYPNSEGKRFDVEYYRKKHIPMLKEKLGEALKGVEVDIGIGSTSGSAAQNKVMCHMLFDSMDAFKTAYAPHAAAFKADLQNFTDIQSIAQISEVIND